MVRAFWLPGCREKSVAVIAAAPAGRRPPYTPACCARTKHEQGDELIATSGVTYTKSSEYGEVIVKMGQQVVRIKTRGQEWATIRAAIGSHPGHIPVKLEFQRCEE